MMFKRLLVAAAVAVAASVAAPAGGAVADPICDGPGLPPCAGPGDPVQQCAVIAWRTFTPCNWWGVKVPQGTPGSL